IPVRSLRVRVSFSEHVRWCSRATWERWALTLRERVHDKTRADSGGADRSRAWFGGAPDKPWTVRVRRGRLHVRRAIRSGGTLAGSPSDATCRLRADRLGARPRPGTAPRYFRAGASWERPERLSPLAWAGVFLLAWFHCESHPGRVHATLALALLSGDHSHYALFRRAVDATRGHRSA